MSRKLNTNILQPIVSPIVPRLEARHIYPCIYTQMGVVDNSAHPNLQWATQTPATITANAMTQISNLTFNGVPGRILVLNKIIVDTTADCYIYLYHKPKFYTTLYNSQSSSQASPQVCSYSRRQTNAGGGEVVFDFSGNPLYLRSDELLQFYYMRSVTTGCNFKMEFIGYDITADENYTADKTMLVLGDSISGITAETSGLQSGLWPFIIRNNYLTSGKNVRLINIAQSATTANQWDYYARFGRLEYFYKKVDIAFINLGANDCDTSVGSGSTTTLFKTALKNIATKINSISSGIPIVFNGITWTNTTTRTANLSAYRTAIAEAVSELVALGINAYHVPMSSLDTAFSTNPTTNGYFVETSANTQLHPSAGTISITGGQTLMANNIWAVVQNLI
jgi:lysophospholipase L1-like esterase